MTTALRTSTRLRVLLIDDEPDLQRAVGDFLRGQSYIVTCAKSAEEALEILEHTTPDIVLLDLNLPQMSGFELCKSLKEHTVRQKVPVVILSSRAAETDKVMGLELGADDYLVKPFGYRELLARMHVALRRHAELANTNQRSLKCGAIALDADSRTASVRGKEISLTPKEFDLLLTLLRNQNKVLTRRFLLETIWGFDYFGTDRTVDVHIRHLRDKFQTEASAIETVERIGYIFRGK